LFIVLNSICLKHDLINESPLPTLEGGPIPVEDCVASLLPNKPHTKHEDLHEELRVEVLLGFNHHHVEGDIEVPVNSQLIPTLGAEGTFEE
jgi:hypothetical protein